MSRKDQTQHPDDEDQPFLSRWSRRKASSREATQPTIGDGHEDIADAAQADEPSLVLEETEDEQALSDDALCERYELMHPDKCETPEQLDGYFSRPLPDRIRQLAMRRLWRINPLFRFADEMVEYGEDYTDAATVIPDMKTAYQVGKGYFDKLFLDKDEDSEAVPEQTLDVTYNEADEPADETVEVASSDDSHDKADKTPSKPQELTPPDRKDQRITASEQIVQPQTENHAPVTKTISDGQAASSQNQQPDDIALADTLPKPQPRRMVFVRKNK